MVFVNYRVDGVEMTLEFARKDIYVLRSIIAVSWALNIHDRLCPLTVLENPAFRKHGCVYV